MCTAEIGNELRNVRPETIGYIIPEDNDEITGSHVSLIQGTQNAEFKITPGVYLPQAIFQICLIHQRELDDKRKSQG